MKNVCTILAALALAIEASVYPRADYPFCPPADAIAPCTCLQEIPTDARPTIICDGLQSGEFAAIFSQLFPINRLLAVRISNSDLGVIGTNYFFDKEVQEISMSQNTITEIAADAFSAIAGGVTSLIIADSPTLASFPWDSLAAMTSLKELAVRGTTIGSIEGLPAVSTITKIDFSNNGLTDLPENVFEGFPQLAELDLSKNALTFLGNYSMAVSTSENLKINFAQNLISGFEVLAFPVVPPYMQINFARNAFSTLEEYSFKSVLDRLEFSLFAEGLIDLIPGTDSATGESIGNKIVCDCNIAWYVTSSNDRKNRLKNAFCEHNGQLISDLPNDYFVGIC